MLVTIARHAKTRGQTLVVVAFGLIVTLLFAGLAIDGSNAYHQRRRMQNAADSGALAGARALASGGNTNAQMLQTVRYYASENGAPSASVTAWYVDNSQKISQIPDDGNAPPSGALGVDAYASTTFTVFFSGVLGMGQKSASAEAVAKMGALGSMGSGAFPLGISDDTVDILTPGQPYKIFDSASTPMTDVNNNPISNAVLGWLNFNWIYNMATPNTRVVATDHSNADLMSWITNGYPNPIYAGPIGSVQGDFINVDPGMRASSISESGVRIGQVVDIPIFDLIYTSSDITTAINQAGATPPGSFPSGVSDHDIHVVGFAAFLIDEVHSTGTLKYIQGRFLKRIGGGTILSGGYSSGASMVGVSLTK